MREITGCAALCAELPSCTSPHIGCLMQACTTCFLPNTWKWKEEYALFLFDMLAGELSAKCCWTVVRMYLVFLCASRICNPSSSPGGFLSCQLRWKLNRREGSHDAASGVLAVPE